ncbi:MAG: hypothetical protein KBC48_02025 [Candidatus Pacebacteria bacterium]|nr:hypothetical protein [Candidatus Paceibacterota bacterium]
MKPKKFRATLQEYPWLGVVIQSLSGSMGRNDLGLVHDIQWAEKNLLDVSTALFDSSILSDGNRDRTYTIGTLPKGIGKKGLTKIVGFMRVNYSIACHHKIRNRIECYNEDGRLIEWVEDDKPKVSYREWTVGAFLKDMTSWENGNYQPKFIVRKVTVGVEGVTSKVQIDIYPCSELK